MTTLVWVHGFEMQCCGAPFAIGKAVSWTTTSGVDLEFLSPVLGDDLAASITASVDNHAGADGTEVTTSETTGTVHSIDAVWCDYENRDNVLHPIGGSTTIEPRTDGDGWEPEGDVRRFLGYLVTLT
jgi:hypothetical protein